MSVISDAGRLRCDETNRIASDVNSPPIIVATWDHFGPVGGSRCKRARSICFSEASSHLAGMFGEGVLMLRRWMFERGSVRVGVEKRGKDGESSGSYKGI